MLKKTKKLDRLVPWPMRNGAGGVAPGRGRGRAGMGVGGWSVGGGEGGFGVRPPDGGVEQYSSPYT